MESWKQHTLVSASTYKRRDSHHKAYLCCVTLASPDLVWTLLTVTGDVTPCPGSFYPDSPLVQIILTMHHFLFVSSVLARMSHSLTPIHLDRAQVGPQGG